MMSTNQLKYGFLYISLFITSLFHAQNTASGKIVDAKTNKEVSAVEVFINESDTPVLTTASGSFTIQSDSIIYKLRFQKKNYALESVDITPDGNSNLLIKLSSEKVSSIEEVVIHNEKTKFKNKKENPAYRIMQEVWKRKRNNGLDKFDTYTYKEYEKIQFDANNLDSAFMNRKIFNKLDFIFDYADSTARGKMALPIFLNESIYNHFGENKPNKKTKKLLVAQKTSGFQDNQVIAITAKNLYRDINIYDNTLNYFDIGFPSPVGTDGFSTYDYNLTDTVSIRGEQAYKIRYQPRRSEVLAFQGYLYIDTDLMRF